MKIKHTYSLPRDCTARLESGATLVADVTDRQSRYRACVTEGNARRRDRTSFDKDLQHRQAERVHDLPHGMWLGGLDL